MSGSALVWHRLRWPREVSLEQVQATLHLLAGAAGGTVVLEAVGDAGHVTHRVAFDAGRGGALVHQLRAIVPGLSCEVDRDRQSLAVGRCAELRISSGRRPLRTEDPAAVSRSLLTALAHVGRGEVLGLQWVLARPLVPVAVPSNLELLPHETWLGALLSAPFEGRRPADAETLGALRAKQAQAGWRAIGRIAVSAGSRARERQLIGQVVGALRTAEGPSVGFRVRSGQPTRFMDAAGSWRRPLRLNVNELSTIAAWPVGGTGQLPVSMIPARLLPPSAAVRREGRVLARASFPGRERPVAISADDARRHVHLLGGTGTGKSTVALNLAVADMRAGRGVVLIEPKGDLIAGLLERVPADRLEDVVLIDPTDTDRPVGLNPLARDGPLAGAGRRPAARRVPRALCGALGPTNAGHPRRVAFDARADPGHDARRATATAHRHRVSSQGGAARSWTRSALSRFGAVLRRGASTNGPPQSHL